MLRRTHLPVMAHADRTNDQWLADLRAADSRTQADAIEALRLRLERGIYYYLSRERSDVGSISTHDLMQMTQDFAQDALLRVLDNLDSFRGDSLFTTWAARVAVRVAISELRRMRYRDFSLDSLTITGEMPPVQLDPLLGVTPPVPERAAERTEVMARIASVIRKHLTDRQYRALIAVAVDQVPMEIVAEQLGTNRNALYKLLHDARRKLRAQLQDEGLSFDYILGLFEDK